MKIEHMRMFFEERGDCFIIFSDHTGAVLTAQTHSCLDSASSVSLPRRVLFVFVFSFLGPWNVTPSSRADTGGVLSERTVGKQTRLTNRSG